MLRKQSKFSRENPVFEPPESAIKIVARSAGCSHEDAQRILKDLIEGGYFVAPRQPSNSMLHAYITSYGQKPTNISSVITAIGKARKRWTAMGSKGTAIALSLYPLRNSKEEAELIPNEKQASKHEAKDT